MLVIGSPELPCEKTFDLAGDHMERLYVVATRGKEALDYMENVEGGPAVPASQSSLKMT